MATYEVLNIQGDYAEDLPVHRPMFSKWELVDTREVKDGQEAEYRLIDGDPKYPAKIRLGVYTKNGRRNISARFETFVKITDDNSVVTYEPWSVVVAPAGPEGATLNATGAGKAVENVLLFSGILSPAATPALSAGSVSRDTTVKDRLTFGIPTVDISDLSDPAES
jgi:hypothetical protein